ncbi:MAG: hypothetical protein ACJA1Z_002668 [Patiriisocius sp.]|jgi:hypothetical protein
MDLFEVCDLLEFVQQFKTNENSKEYQYKL